MRPTTLQFHPNSFLHWDNYTGSYLSIISLCLVPVYIVMSVAQLKQSTESLEHHFAVHNEIKKSKVENKTPPPKRPAGNLAGIWDLGSGIWDLGSANSTAAQARCFSSHISISYFVSPSHHLISSMAVYYLHHRLQLSQSFAQIIVPFCLIW
jgi:hypothetical protein